MEWQQVPLLVLATGAAVCLAAVCVATGWLAVLKVHNRIYRAGVDAERSWAQNRLRAAAWWFSEDPATMHLLMDLANANLDEWQARDKWRKARVEEGRP